MMNISELGWTLQWVDDVINGEVITTPTSDETRTILTSHTDHVSLICDCVNAYLRGMNSNKRVYNFSQTVYIKEVTPDDEKLDAARYFLNTTTGDLLLTWYEQNFPKEADWVELSENCYKIITKSTLGG